MTDPETVHGDRMVQAGELIAPILEEVFEGDFHIATGALISMAAAMAKIKDDGGEKKQLRAHLRLFRKVYALPVPE